MTGLYLIGSDVWPGLAKIAEGPVALADKAAAFPIARALLGRRP